MRNESIRRREALIGIATAVASTGSLAQSNQPLKIVVPSRPVVPPMYCRA